MERGPARVPRLGALIGFVDRLPGKAFVIDQADWLGYLASDARVRDSSTGTVVARLAEAAASCLRETAKPFPKHTA